MLEKKIELLGEYFDGMFRLPQNYNGVRVIIPSTWKAGTKETDEYTIEPNVSEIVNNDYVKMIFVGTPKATVNDIMDYTYKVIVDNLEIEKKKEFFQIKLKELVNLFDANQLSKLETLVFKFEKPKKVKKEKENSKEPIEITVETILEDSDELDEFKKLAEDKE